LFELIVFWAVGLQGSFWKWYACLFLLVFNSNLLAYPLTSIPNDPRTGVDLIAVVFAPQLLFSGFIVAPASIPIYFKWLMWLQPSTYGFRLMSNNEFEGCLVRSEEEQHLANCATAFQNMIAQDAGVLFTPESKLTVVQTGQYIGGDDILEYFGFLSPGEAPLSLLWNTCGVSCLNLSEATFGVPNGTKSYSSPFLYTDRQQALKSLRSTKLEKDSAM
jgi:hypothetical protein